MDYITKPNVENVLLQRNLRISKNYITGTLYTFPTSFLFKCNESDATSKGLLSIPGGEIQVPHCQIKSIERLNLTPSGTPLYIRCKTFLVLKFIFRREPDANDVERTLNRLSRPVSIEEISVLNYRPNSVHCLASQRSGWHVFDINIEYARFGVPNNDWIQCWLNKDYKLCPTYPKWLFVPSEATSEIVTGSAKFRSQGRLPGLSFIYQPTGAAICRCSQPCVGITNNRSEFDEKMVSCIRMANKKSKNKIYIVDTRPKVNAMVNKAGGKGYEDVKNYTDVLYKNFPIQNIHVMRESMAKLRNTLEMAISPSAHLSGVEESGWLSHAKVVLNTAKFIARAVSVEGYSVLIHCSDGWDRTAQTSSLSQILLDPYYRSLNGFQVLIEKEWLAFGHKFVDRCSLLCRNPDEASPIFLQFLDCVFQLQNQFPTHFEFNENYLIELYDMLTAGKFGTFLGNNEKDRNRQRLSERTFSIWGYLWENINKFINPYFEHGADINSDNSQVLHPSTDDRDLLLWTKMYCRYDLCCEAKTAMDIDVETSNDLKAVTEKLSEAEVGN